MRQLIVKQLDYDLTPVAGLSLVGHLLQPLRPVFKRIDAALPVVGGVPNSDVLRSYLGLLVQGKSDFDAIGNFRGDAFYKQALGIGLLPSSPTLRQRMDARASALFDFVPQMSETLLTGQRCDYGVLACGWLALDIDTFAMDNGGTLKEGVGRTYAGVDGYCPLAAYLGQHGYCLELALRPGVQHSAKETDFNLERVIPMAQRLSAAGSKAPILVRLDSGFDSAALMRGIEACNQAGTPQVDWLIKWNPRSTGVAALSERLDAEPTTAWQPSARRQAHDGVARGLAHRRHRAAAAPRAAAHRAHHRCARPGAHRAPTHAGGLDHQLARAVQCPGHHRAVRRARHP